MAHPGAADLLTAMSLSGAAGGTPLSEILSGSASLTPNGSEGGAGEDFWHAIKWLDSLDPTQASCLERLSRPWCV